MEQNTVNERLNYLVKYFEFGKKAAFARKAGISPQGAQELLAGRKGDPSFKVLVKILEAYPQVYADWLVLGRGPMLQSEEPTPVAMEYQAQVTATKEVEEISTLVRREMAKLMTQNTRYQINEMLKHELNEAMASNRANQILRLEAEAAEIKDELEKISDYQSVEAIKLSYRLGEIEQAIHHMKTTDFSTH